MQKKRKVKKKDKFVYKSFITIEGTEKDAAMARTLGI